MAALLSFAGCHSTLPAGDYNSRLATPADSARMSNIRLEAVTQGGNVLFSIPMQGDNRWCLLWNHSVAGFTVSDCFEIAGDVMYLVSSHQPDFAAGLGYIEGRGKLTSDGQGGYIITDMYEPVPNNSLVLRVGSTAVNHRVWYQGKETSLSQFAAGQLVALRLSGH